MRNLSYLSATAALLLGAAAACSDDGKTPEEPVPPSITAQITSLDRTRVAFTLTAEHAADWAYVIRETGRTAPASAEELFSEADESGMFEAATTVALENRRIQGGKTYTLYAAARQINPFVYSPLTSEDFDTDLAYEDPITLDAVATDGFTYHIKPAEGGGIIAT